MICWLRDALTLEGVSSTALNFVFFRTDADPSWIEIQSESFRLRDEDELVVNCSRRGVFSLSFVLDAVWMDVLRG